MFAIRLRPFGIYKLGDKLYKTSNGIYVLAKSETDACEILAACKHSGNNLEFVCTINSGDQISYAGGVSFYVTYSGGVQDALSSLVFCDQFWLNKKAIDACIAYVS